MSNMPNMIDGKALRGGMDARRLPYWVLGDISLRLASPGDARAVMCLRNASPEDAERSYDRIECPMDMDEATALLRERIAESATTDRRLFLIEGHADASRISRQGGDGRGCASSMADDAQPAAEVVGQVDVWDADRRSGVFRAGIKMLPFAQGKGFARSAYARVLDYYFFELRYQKCGVYIYEFNSRSLKFHKSMGFVEEGRLRRECFTDGRYYDSYWLGLTAEEHADRRARGHELLPPQRA